MTRGLRGLALILLGGACVGAPPPAPGMGTDESSSGSGEATSTTAPVDGTTDGGASTTSGAPGDTTASETGTAELILSDGPVFDFGDVTLGDTAQQLFAVTNVGDGTATGLTGSSLTAPFAYVGGGFPGQAGDCGDSLDPGSVCLVEVELSPDHFGPVDDRIAVTHDDGEASVDLVARGVGQSDNLLVNPGGEDLGSPPPGWSDVGAGVWIAEESTTVMPYEGLGVIAAAEGPNGSYYILQQVVSLSDEVWLELIDAGQLRLSFRGWTRSRIGNDEHRILVRLRDGLAVTLDELDTPWSADPSWSEVSYSPLMPPDTRSIEVELYCRKIQGTECSAFYDALELRVEYP